MFLDLLLHPIQVKPQQRLGRWMIHKRSAMPFQRIRSTSPSLQRHWTRRKIICKKAVWQEHGPDMDGPGLTRA